MPNPTRAPDALLAALIAAPAGSRELDAIVAEAFGWTWRNSVELWVKPGWCDATGQRQGFDLPHWTTSVDAALSLAPTDTINNGQRLWWIDARGLLGDWPVIEMGKNTEELPCISVQAKTPPLAIVIACFRARDAGA